MTSSTPDDATQLLRAVHDLAATVTEQTSALQLVAAETRANTVELAKQDRRGKWNRRLIWLLAVVVTAVLVLGVFVWRSAAYASCNSNRGKALQGPANDRVSFFLQAYTEAAGSGVKPLTAAQKAELIAGLDRDRSEFTAIPAHAELVKSKDTQLLAYRDLLRSLRANHDYQALSDRHPVCTFWGS